MVIPFNRQKTDDRNLQVAAAVAREAILALHSELALEFLALGRGHLEPRAMIARYSRVHGLAGATAAIVGGRVLAALGRGGPEGTAGREAGRPDRSNGRRPGVWGKLRWLLRRRVPEEVERWMELHGGRAEILVLEQHARNAARLVEVLGPRVSIARAVDTYCDLLEVQPELCETVYLLTLKHLGETGLPGRAEEIAPFPLQALHETSTSDLNGAALAAGEPVAQLAG